MSIQGGSTVFADVNGDFVLPNGGNGEVTVDSTIRGEYFRVFNNGGACMGLARAIGLADTHLRNQARKQEAGTATGIPWGPAITFKKVCNLIAMNMLAGEPVGRKKENCDSKDIWCDE